MSARDRRSGRDRRANRPMMTRGPIARTLELLSAVTGLIAIAALVVSLTTQSEQIAGIQSSRIRAAEDSCYLLHALVLAAAPAGQRHRAVDYIDRTQLRDCRAYARRITRVPR